MDLKLVPITIEDVPSVMAVQADVLPVLPSSRWYFPSTADEFAQTISSGMAWGIRMEDGGLAAFCIAEESDKHRYSYAACLGYEPKDALDFEDVMVRPAWRRQGIHTMMIRRIAEEARARGRHYVFATADPENIPSRSCFEKAGYVLLQTREMYDGRPRCLYMLELKDDGSCC